jgi:hypothetical protein
MDVTVTLQNTTHKRTLPPKKSGWTDVVVTGSGVRVKSDNSKNFLALSLTDTENRTSVGQLTFSEWYDWGFTVLPTSILTSQVLIGWGYVVLLCKVDFAVEAMQLNVALSNLQLCMHEQQLLWKTRSQCDLGLTHGNVRHLH